MGQTYPLPITKAMTDPVNANAPKPRYLGAGVALDWINGVKGDDVSLATAALAVARQDGAAADATYAPLNQAAKATALGTTIAVDVARGRGWISPQQPYNGNEANPAAPVVSSLSPATAAAATLPLQVTITGTGFSVWSQVYTGGMSTPEAKAVYVNPTTMTVPIWAAAPGNVSVVVVDHGKVSNTDKNFVVT